METLRQSPPPRLDLNGKINHAHSVPRATVELLRYWRVIRPHLLFIGAATFVVMVAVVLFDLFIVTPKYRAQATIIPEMPGEELEGAASAAMGAMTGGLSGLGMSLLGNDQNELVAQQDIVILNAYGFTMDLVKRLALEKKIIERDGDDPKELGPWKIYKAINGAFDSDYDYKSGSLTVYYVDSDPVLARQVLTQYLDDLREILRAQTAGRSEAAVKGLEQEAARTSDPALRQQIFTILAYELQRQHTAEMDADFAFREIEAPVVPSKWFSPHLARDPVLLGGLVFSLLCAWYLTRHWLAHAQTHVDALDSHMNPATVPAPSPEEQHADGAPLANGRTNAEF